MSTLRSSYDVIVVGAGSMGMSAGYHLASRGARTLLIDAFDPPHSNGSHHGEPRLIRHAYSGGAIYTELALRSHELWNELEDASGEKLLVQSGVINMASPGVYSLEDKRDSSAAFKVEVEYLDADEIQKRWPGIQLPEHYQGLYEPNAGYLFSERCVAAYRKQALAAGAELLVNTIIRHIEADGEGVAVHTPGGIIRAGKVIVSAGAWFKTLEPFITLPIRPVRKTVGWFESAEPLFNESVFPGFTLGTENGGYYGFPSIGGAGVKIGRHDTGVPWLPGEDVKPFGSYPEDEGDIRQALETFMPQAAGKLLRGAVCKYEFTPDEDFIIDVHPEQPNVWLAGGFSGHGFKFSSAVGELLADLAWDGSTKRDIGLFSLARFQQASSR
ncbi:N-methyl-L-tryptophan oxidase [Paenibacillus gorillae]|uniref:N-methyl-L-tryptophan oxidase n=1 Tax=Paenibacillus gorillae TaxID=1243662 RepID=UPI0004B7A0C4|nr:N-methyl-L-tryptophan oxidase [Paenibacillus gorillae]